MLEEICGIPVLGIIPYFKDIHIEEEDSVSLEKKNMEAAEGKVNIAVVMLRHLSNFTDFDVLERDPRVHLFYTNNTEEIRKADIIILPGSKSTIADMVELRRNGCAQAILQAHHDGKTVIGICGGYQMMGEEILDPQHVEGDLERFPGLGLLPAVTTMSGEKRTVQVTFDFQGQSCQGYEIHMGKTQRVDRDGLHTELAEQSSTTMRLSQRCWGSYIHGILDNAPVVDDLLAPFVNAQQTTFDYRAYKEEQYNLLAAETRKYIDMEKVYEIVKAER